MYIDKAEILSVLRSRGLHARAAWVDRELPELINLCGCPHRWTYADTATMPRFSVRAGRRAFETRGSSSGGLC